ncbi:MAG: LysR family transcriptional regulator [Caulobacteraceae bacterium]|nr:LysR family transcriptional regulator [Caulobacteraceae bacterium]
MDGSDALFSTEVQTAMAVAELASFSRAGRRLSVEQSTVSRRIRGLEERLGVALFERGPFGIRLTPAGRLFLARLARSRSLLSDALSEARRTGAAETGVLKLGAAWTFAAGRAQALVMAFRERQSGVRLLLTERGPTDLIAMLLSGDLDCAFVDPASASEPGLCVEPLWRERVYLASSADRRPLPAHRVLLCRTADDGLGLARRFRPAGDEPAEVQVHDCSRDSLLALVASGEGVTLAPESVAALGGNGVRFSPAPGPDAYTQVGAAWRRESGNPALNRFIGLARRLPAQAGH